MKHRTAAALLALACAVPARVRAQEAPPPEAPPAPADAAPATEAEAPAEGAPPATAAPAPAPAPTPPPAPAAAAEAASATDVAAETDAAPRERDFLGLGVGTPDVSTLPGRFRPAYGVAPRSASDYRFDFHGYLIVSLRFGMNQRENPSRYQYETVLHGPPLVPDDFERFEHTGVVPQPWVQLGFSYGNSKAVATVIIAARSVSTAAGFFDPPTQLGVNDAWITFTPGFSGLDLQVDVGGFADRYGGMGEYDLGRYDTPVIARVGGVGETTRLRLPLGDSALFLAEHGVMGQLDKAPLGVEPAGWNAFADPNVGTSFAHHAHLGLALPKLAKVGVHYVGAFSQDDRTAPATPDGTITVLGADASAELATFGRLYAVVGHAIADDARSVSGVVRVLNTFGGPGLIREYLGPASGGNGSLTTVGAQYDVSIGQLVRSPQPYSGYAPDLFASVFGMFTNVSSDDDAFDGVGKLKYGAELTYSALSWLAFGTRYDRVVADLDDDRRTFAVLSPRLILRTDYNSQDQVTLQYSRWFYGSGVNVRTGYPPREDASVEPDQDTFSLSASMWW